MYVCTKRSPRKDISVDSLMLNFIGAEAFEWRTEVRIGSVPVPIFSKRAKSLEKCTKSIGAYLKYSFGIM